MPTWTDERPRRQHDRDRQPGSRPAAEPRNLDARAVENATPRRGPHAGYDAELNPIDDEYINTHGSER
jgi:hypothetical protein